MKVLVTGASGLIGSVLTRYLKEKKYEVATLVRSRDKLTNETAIWEPEGDVLERPYIVEVADNCPVVDVAHEFVWVFLAADLVPPAVNVM